MKRLLAAAALCLVAPGCFSLHRGPPMPGATYVSSRPVVVPARLLGNVMVVEAKYDKAGPYHFVIDTGSSVTLVSPDLARRYAEPEGPPAGVPKVRVRSAEGGSVLLDAVSLSKLQLGSARFEHVPALVFDCSELSAHFGTRIDGVLGFPIFRNAVLTLDYPRERIVLRRAIPKDGMPGEAILFNNADRTPLIPVRLGDHEFAALIDSGSSGAIALNPAGLSPTFSYGPVEGPAIETLAGDRLPRVGRLADVVRMGSFDIPRPVAEITDELSALGGGILCHFTVTFDQEGNEVFFQHDPADTLAMAALRGTGISFTRTPAYWKVAGVMAGSPGASAGVKAGDLVSRINGEPVAAWDLPRYDRELAKAGHIDFAFIDGARETLRPVPVVDLVP
jgi:hypothetical protein